MTLFHYTCAHGRKAISARGMLRPQPQPVLGGVLLLWLTEQERPNRRGLGLTSQILDCDRLQYRYIVNVDDARPWSVERERFPAHMRMRLEAVEGAEPHNWWVIDHSILGILDRRWGGHAGVEVDPQGKVGP